MPQADLLRPSLHVFYNNYGMPLLDLGVITPPPLHDNPHPFNNTFGMYSYVATVRRGMNPSLFVPLWHYHQREAGR